MSLVRRTNSSSSATSFSSRLRSGINRFVAAGSVQGVGAASFFPMSASPLPMRPGSKILPQVAHLVAHGSVGQFEIVQRHGLVRPGFELAKLAVFAELTELDLWLALRRSASHDRPTNNAYRKYGTEPREHVA